MKTAIRLGPIAHLRRAKLEVVAYGNQACEFGINPHSHTWLPYITPNGVRLVHETLMILSLVVRKKVGTNQYKLILNTYLPTSVCITYYLLLIT